MQETGNPKNPWGLNNDEHGPFTYRDTEVPVIDPETSSREDLLRYIRVLENRLDLTHVYMMNRRGEFPEGLEDAGVPQLYDLPPKERDTKNTLLELIRVSQNQSQRVAMLCRGTDRVGCLEIGQRHYKDMALGKDFPLVDDEDVDGTPEQGDTTA